jgi:hypothetical protein
MLIQSIYSLLENLFSPLRYCHLAGPVTASSKDHFTVLSSQLFHVRNMVINEHDALLHFFDCESKCFHPKQHFGVLQQWIRHPVSPHMIVLAEVLHGGKTNPYSE